MFNLKNDPILAAVAAAYTSQIVVEALDPKADAGVWISDFVNSKDPRFDGKSADERKQQALAAWYAARKEAGIKEETEQEDDKKSDVGDGDGDADDFQTDTAKEDEDDAENENEGEEDEGPGAAEAGPEVTGGEGEKAFKAGHDANTKVEEAPYTNKADGSDKIVPAAKPAPNPTQAEKLPENTTMFDSKPMKNLANAYAGMVNETAKIDEGLLDVFKKTPEKEKDSHAAHASSADAHLASRHANDHSTPERHAAAAIAHGKASSAHAQAADSHTNKHRSQNKAGTHHYAMSTYHHQLYKHHDKLSKQS